MHRCLLALKKQTRPASEVIIVVRDSDSDTWQFIKNFDAGNLTIKSLKIFVPGVVAALNLGLNAISGDIVSITDDDAEPHTNWLELITDHFIQDDTLGAVGGRDWVYHGSEIESGISSLVGKLMWFGGVVGNHHIGVGEPREVDILKGVNMSFRYNAIYSMRFDQRMRGTGAQVHFEMAFSLALKQAGWKLIYDPKVAVNHYPAKRFDEDQRNSFNQLAFTNLVHNETLALLDFLPPIRRYVFIVWAVLIGSRNGFGLVQLFRFLPYEGDLAIKKLIASLDGRIQGWKTWSQSKKFWQDDSASHLTFRG